MHLQLLSLFTRRSLIFGHCQTAHWLGCTEMRLLIFLFLAGWDSLTCYFLSLCCNRRDRGLLRKATVCCLVPLATASKTMFLSNCWIHDPHGMYNHPSTIQSILQTNTKVPIRKLWKQNLKMLFPNPTSEGIRNTLYIVVHSNEITPKPALLQTKKVRDKALMWVLTKLRPFPVCYFIFSCASIKVSIKASNLIYNTYCI